MASESILSTGAINTIANDPRNAPDLGSPPVLQCLKAKLLQFSTSATVDRYNVVLGDGIHWIHSLLSSHLNHLIEDGKLVRGCICRITKCIGMHVKNRTILVLLDMEVLEEMGIRGTIGALSEVAPKAGEHGQTIDWKSESPVYDLPYELPLSRFPQEIFDMIMSHIDQTDRLALSLTSKTLCARVRTSLCSFVRLRGRTGLKKFANAVASNPKVYDDVRTCWLVGDICCVDPADPSMDFDIERLSMLREFRFQPGHDITRQCAFLIPMLQKIASSRMIRSLKSFHLDLRYTINGDSLEGISEQIFQTIIFILSTPSLERIALFYRPREGQVNYDNSLFDLPPGNPLSLPRTKFTNLRSLTLHWNALPLPYLPGLLQLPHNLESITLHLSLRCSLPRSKSNLPIPLDVALEPVITSLQTLSLLTVENNGSETPESRKLKIGPNGLTHFTALRHLSISSLFLAEAHGFNGKTPWFPPLLTSLCLTDTQLHECSPALDSSVIDNDEGTCGRQFVTLDPDTSSRLTSISGMLDSIPSIKLFEIRCDGRKHLLCRYKLCAHSLPTVIVGESLRPLVDRGLRIGLEVAGLVRVLLDIRVEAGF